MDIDSEPVPNCPGHGLPARLWWTRKQPPRQFYRCPKPIGSQCKFFAWVDPEDSTLAQVDAIPPTPDSARPFKQVLPASPSTPTPASGNVSDINVNFQRKYFHLDAGPESGIIVTPRTPVGPEHPTNPNQGLLSPIGLEATLSQQNDTHLQSDVSVPSSSQDSRGVDVKELSSDLVAGVVHQLGNLPDYLMKLERQRIAADRSREAKNAAIINLQSEVNRLEAEVARLKAREQALETVISSRFER